VKTPPHPLEAALLARVQLLATTLRPSTVANYRHTIRLFMAYLRQHFPEIRRPDQLKRDPHILRWLEYLWTQQASFTKLPLSSSSRSAHLLRLRKLFELMADHRFPPRPGLLWSQDIPRTEDPLPRPLTPEGDDQLKTELRRRNDLLSNALLLTRLTGVRPGEAVDLSVDCLRHFGDGQWMLHVPAVKVLRERWVPVDQEVRSIVARLTYLRTLPVPQRCAPATPQQFLLPRPKGRHELGTQLRAALQEAASQCGITAHIVPYQLRHTFATSMLRAGVSLPALMQLLGHKKANMTLRYLEITQQDLQRELELVRLNPRHLVPLPPLAVPTEIDTADAPTVIDRLSAATHALDLFRQHHVQEDDRPLELLLRRLSRIRTRFQNLAFNTKAEK
jgi:site-specific recombinase XerD